MENKRILLAEDEPALAHIIRESLEEAKFSVTLCPNGEEALNEYLRCRPDILVLDVSMPVRTGFEVARVVRNRDRHIPILFLTARTQPKDVVAGFQAGGNDYLKKPFSLEELIVRINALIDRDILFRAGTEETTFKLGSMIFSPRKNCLLTENGKIPLTSREAELLHLLCSSSRDIVPRDLILTKIWGANSFFNARSLDVFITRLRNKLAVEPSVQIINIRGLGYRLID